MKLNRIYLEDCIKTIRRMPKGGLDLTVTSPPYNVNLGNNKYNKNPYDRYRDNREHWTYIAWLKEIFSAIYTKTKDGGRCVINIGSGRNGLIPTYSDVTQFMTDIGWIPFATIMWNKNQTSNRAAFGSWMSCSSPSFPTPFEFILVFCKNSKKLKTKGVTDLTKEEFIKWSLALWTFAPESKMKAIGHPSMFPLELPIRCIKMLSWIGAVVYDPFIGAGTTAVACVRLNRKFIGNEISADYIKIANDRIEVEKNP